MAAAPAPDHGAPTDTYTHTSNETTTSAAAATATVPLPPLVCVLAGNSVTSTTIFAYLNTADTGPLRRLHPAVATAVAAVPWCDVTTRVTHVVAWRAALPAAVGAWLTRLPVAGKLAGVVAAALVGISRLELANCAAVTDAALGHLPLSLRVLNVSGCRHLTARASFAHLTALEVLDCSSTEAASDGVGRMPPSLRELRVQGCAVPPSADYRRFSALQHLAGPRDVTLANLPASLEELDATCRALTQVPGSSLAHLTQLRVLHMNLDDTALASLPPACLLELELRVPSVLTHAAAFGHLRSLRVLLASRCGIRDTSLATLPPSLVLLDVSGCPFLSSAAVLPPHLLALRVLDVSGTRVGDAMVASAPAGLVELRMVDCPSVTRDATLGHLAALRQLHSSGTDLSPALLAACRARGCAAPAAGVLRGHENGVMSLASFADGRLASGDCFTEVRLWEDVGSGGPAAALLYVNDDEVCALATFPDGRRLAIGIGKHASGGLAHRVEVWDANKTPLARLTALACGPGASALAALRGGRLALGCGDGAVWVVNDVGAVVAKLDGGHTDSVCALAVLPDGRLASGSWDATVRVWDDSVRSCTAVLAGHTDKVYALVVLADGRLASGSADKTVRLWDVAATVCVGMLTGHTDAVAALAALPDGRLVSAARDGTIRLWDTRRGAAADVYGEVVVPRLPAVGALALVSGVPGDIIASGGANDEAIRLWTMPPPPPTAAL